MVDSARPFKTVQAAKNSENESRADAKARFQGPDNKANIVGISKPQQLQKPNLARQEATKKPDIGAKKLAALNARIAAAEKILSMEAQLRELGSRKELRYFAANEFTSLIPCEQILVHEKGQRNFSGRITTVTGIAAPDPNAPLLQWLQNETAIQAGNEQPKPEKPIGVGEHPESPGITQFRLATEKAPGGGFSLPCAVTVKLPGIGIASQGAITFLSRRTLEGEHLALAKRLCETYAHAERQYLPRGAGALAGKLKPMLAAGLLACALAMFIPVPLTVLAPVIIEPHQPEIVSAPLSGVIENVHVHPNGQVKPGDLLFSFNRTEWQNQHELAEQKITIAEARLKRANQDAFNAAEGRRELAITKSELALALAERKAAARRLSMVEVRARKEGIVLFDSEEKWKGRPVSTGERVMRIADPASTRFGIDLAADDSIILADDAPVRVFLDADPLNPINATLTSTSYVAEITERDQLAFSLQAVPVEEDEGQMRIGLKGTAQLYGDKVPLWFYLFRKPLSFLRQYFGF